MHLAVESRRVAVKSSPVKRECKLHLTAVGVGDTVIGGAIGGAIRGAIGSARGERA